MDAIWIIAEQSHGALRDVSFELLAWGRSLAEKRHARLRAVVLANGIGDEALGELITHGADDVVCIEHPVLGDFVCETYARALADLA
ncbi:MAG TPA: electron transfer flavoprotein subunit alpha, partial [Spirochaetia bacterium]